MASPEEKARKRQRIKSHITKDLHSAKYRQRVKEDKKKKVCTDVKNLTHADLVRIINEREEDNGKPD